MSDTIKLSNSELMELTRRANSRTNRAEDARRARLTHDRLIANEE